MWLKILLLFILGLYLPVQALTFDLLFELYEQACMQEDLEKKLDLFNQVLDIDPQFVPALRKRVELEGKKSNWETVLEDYSLLIELKPSREEFYWGRAETLEQMGRPKKALMDFQTLLNMNPTHGEAQKKVQNLLQSFLAQMEKEVLAPPHHPNPLSPLPSLNEIRKPESLKQDRLPVDPPDLKTPKNNLHPENPLRKFALPLFGVTFFLGLLLTLACMLGRGNVYAQTYSPGSRRKAPKRSRKQPKEKRGVVPRRLPRTPVVLPVHCISLISGDFYGALFDMNLDGVGLLSDVNLKEEETVELVFDQHGGKKIPIKVIYSHKQADGSFKNGGSFVHLFSDQENFLRTLLLQHAH